MASANPQFRQSVESFATEVEQVRGTVWDPADRCRMLARSLQSALDNVESLHLYARSIVRMLEACEAEASLTHMRSRRSGSARTRRPSLDLDFVREDVDRLASEVQAQLALLRAGIQRVERES